MESSDYLLEYIHSVLPLDHQLDHWSELFEHARVNWDLPLAHRLLREAKLHELSGYAQAVVYRAEGLLASQRGELVQALRYLLVSLELFEQQGDLDQILFTSSQVGMIQRARGQPQLAIGYHVRQLELAKDHEAMDWQVNAYKELGFDYYELGNWNQAYQHLEIGLALASTPEDLAELHNTIGLVAWKQSDLQRARYHFEDALRGFQEIGEAYSAAQTRANLGNIYYALDNIEQALKHYTAALEIFDQIGSLFDKIGLLNNLGGIAVRRSDQADAQMYFEESLALANEVDDRMGQQNALINLGVIAMQQGDYEQSLEHYHKALSMVRDIGNYATARQLHRKIARLELIWSIETFRRLLKQEDSVSAGMIWSHFLKSSLSFLYSVFILRYS